MGSSGGANLQNPPTAAPSNTSAPVVGEGQSPVNSAAWVNFLGPGMGMSTGFTPGIEQQLKDMYGPGYNGYSAGGGSAPGGGNSPAAASMTVPQLKPPAEGSMRGWFQQAAQQTADKANSMNSLDAYLAARDQLAKLQTLGRFTRGQGSGGNILGGSGSSAGYGTSGR